MSQPEPLPVALQAQREKTITALIDHFANDRLTVEEFERRLDVAARAQALPELSSLLEDLPTSQTTSAPTPSVSSSPAPSHHAREHQTLVAIMGGVERRGRWQPAEKTVLIAVMGGALLDFREVQLPPGVTQVTLICVMGGAEVIVPPGMTVDTGGFAIMGGFAHRHDTPPTRDENTPVLRIDGFAFMGGVDLQVRLPGETENDTKQRMREERRRLRDERRQR
jgi:hypothetical protein